jgi:hypothetical protein
MGTVSSQMTTLYDNQDDNPNGNSNYHTRWPPIWQHQMSTSNDYTKWRHQIPISDDSTRWRPRRQLRWQPQMTKQDNATSVIECHIRGQLQVKTQMAIEITTLSENTTCQSRWQHQVSTQMTTLIVNNHQMKTQMATPSDNNPQMTTRMTIQVTTQLVVSSEMTRSPC